MAPSAAYSALVAVVPRDGTISGDVLSDGNKAGTMSVNLLSLVVLAICLALRMQGVRSWKKLAFSYWLVLAIYVDSLLFILSTALVKDLGVNTSESLCQAAILLCLAFYISSKILVYIFLVEKARMVRGRGVPRLRDKLYMFNIFGMLLPYIGIAIANFVMRIGYIREDGVCIIGMERVVLFPLVSFDVLVNVYLTVAFLVPVLHLQSFNNNPRLRRVVIRTFIGTLATLASSVANITALGIMKGEPGWICLILCNVDVLFTTLVLHWITMPGSHGDTTGSDSSKGQTAFGSLPLTRITKNVTIQQTDDDATDADHHGISTTITTRRADVILEAERNISFEARREKADEFGSQESLRREKV